MWALWMTIACNSKGPDPGCSDGFHCGVPDLAEFHQWTMEGLDPGASPTWVDDISGDGSPDLVLNGSGSDASTLFIVEAVPLGPLQVEATAHARVDVESSTHLASIRPAVLDVDRDGIADLVAPSTDDDYGTWSVAFGPVPSGEQTFDASATLLDDRGQPVHGTVATTADDALIVSSTTYNDLGAALAIDPSTEQLRSVWAGSLGLVPQWYAATSFQGPDGTTQLAIAESGTLFLISPDAPSGVLADMATESVETSSVIVEVCVSDLSNSGTASLVIGTSTSIDVYEDPAQAPTTTIEGDGALACRGDFDGDGANDLAVRHSAGVALLVGVEPGTYTLEDISAQVAATNVRGLVAIPDGNDDSQDELLVTTSEGVAVLDWSTWSYW